MNNKGFTLVELLGVIIIIAVIATLVLPTVTNILTQSKETIYQRQINTILNATYDFSLKNTNYLPDSNQTKYITLGQLKSEGLIDINIKNPNTEKLFPDNVVISITYIENKPNNVNLYSKLEGNYLYSINENSINSSIPKNLLPTITLSNSSNTIKQNSNGNYILTLNLNSKMDSIIATASKNGVDLTHRLVSNIILNNNPVDKIDTSKVAIYKINYSVVDDNGYANSAILNIIIGDIEKPEIKLETSTKISKEVTFFDLMEDVTCNDNSGFCDITFIGTIEYGVKDTYIIEYTAKDPSGNTTTQKRAITVE